MKAGLIDLFVHQSSVGSMYSTTQTREFCSSPKSEIEISIVLNREKFSFRFLFLFSILFLFLSGNCNILRVKNLFPSYVKSNFVVLRFLVIDLSKRHWRTVKRIFLQIKIVPKHAASSFVVDIIALNSLAVISFTTIFSTCLPDSYKTTKENICLSVQLNWLGTERLLQLKRYLLHLQKALNVNETIPAFLRIRKGKALMFCERSMPRKTLEIHWSLQNTEGEAPWRHHNFMELSLSLADSILINWQICKALFFHNESSDLWSLETVSPNKRSFFNLDEIKLLHYIIPMLICITEIRGKLVLF